MAENTATGGVPAPLAQIELGNVLRIPAVRQMTLLIGVAAAVALGVAAFLWAQGPDLRPLFSDLSGADASEVVTALNAAGIENKLDSSGSRVLVPRDQLHEARLELAGQGLPQGSNLGVEMMSEQSSFGVSQFMESARYQHALESELGRTIGYLRAVHDARIHLALPRQSSFLRDKNQPSASVLLTMHRGRVLEPGQIQSIVHLVASSIPNLAADAVTVIDQQGRLLSGRDSDDNLALSSAQFEYTQNMENVYRSRVVDLLTPIVGMGRVRAQVVADLDFTVTEETRESYDPERTVIRSEATNEREQSAADAESGGVPGALSNQPPETGGVVNPAASGEGAETVNRSLSSERHYEMDKRVSVVRQPVGSIRKLSVAVLIDDSVAIGAVQSDASSEDDVAAGGGLSQADIDRFTALIKEAVGFNETRGDTVSIINVPFQTAAAPPEVEEPAIWQKPGLQALARNVVGILVVLGIGFGLGRPLLKGLLETTPTAAGVLHVPATGEILPAGSAAPGGVTPLAPAYSYEQKVAAARNITGHDPARVAQVLRKWVAEDE